MVHFILLFTFTTGPSLCTRVQQVPSSILGSIHGETRISCNHSESTYNVILWYQKPRGDSALKLIGYILYGNPTIEDGFQESFKISGDGSVKSQLEVEKLKAEDSGSYYCAASTHSELVNILLLQKPYMILRHINKQQRRAHLHLAAVYGRKSPVISAIKPSLPVLAHTEECIDDEVTHIM